MTGCPDPAALRRFLEGQFADAEAQALTLHVETCPACQKELEAQTAAVPVLLVPLPPTVPMAVAAAAVPAAPVVPDHDVFEELGRGGMGVVYRARQRKLDRLVALKLIRPEILGHPSTDRDAVTARFRREARAAALIGHPHIIPVHDVGEAHGCLYYTMHLVDGPSLAKIRLDGPLPAALAVRYVERIARALQCAHEHGILHRDLKPANILLDSRGHPYLADFGVAQWREAARDQTQTGVLIGTPEYMSPEQATSARTIGPAADIYSLGATLYDLLTGRPPFQAATSVETLHQLLNNDPVPPRRLNPAIDRDLECIVLKCLDKEPTRRYASAFALAEDLTRYQTGQPIHARPLGTGARLVRWARRHPGTAWASAVAGVCLLALLVLAVVTSFQRHALRVQAEAAQRRERIQTTQTALLYAIGRCEAGDVAEGLLLFANTLKLLPEDEPDLEREVRLQLTAWTAGLQPVLPLAQKERVIRSVFSPDGKLLATGDATGKVVIWDAATGARLVGPIAHPDKVNAQAFSPDGSLLATACEDGKVRVWRAATGDLVATTPHLGHAALAVAFSRSGSLLATGCGETPGQRGEAALWAVPGLDLLRRLAAKGGKPVRALDFGPGDRLLAAGSEEHVIRVWDVPTGRLHHALSTVTWNRGLVFDPTGKTLAAWDGRPEIQLWQLDGPTPRPRHVQTPQAIHGLVYSADGKTLHAVAEVGSEGEVQAWDVARGVPSEGPRPTLFSARTLAVKDGVIRLASTGWNAALGALPLDPPAVARLRLPSEVRQAAWNPAGTRLVTGDQTAVVLWDGQGNRLAGGNTECAPVCGVGWTMDGRRLAVAGIGMAAEVRAADGLAPLTPPLRHPAWVYHSLFDPAGQTLYTADEAGDVRTWDLRQDPPAAEVRLRLKVPVHGAALSADGAVFVTGTRDGLARRWRTDTWEQVGPTLEHPGHVYAVALSGDGRTLLTGCQDRAVRWWDVQTGRLAGKPMKHPEQVWTVALRGEDGLAATGYDLRGGGAARLWHLASGRPIGPPLHHAGGLRVVAFSPDGSTLLTGGTDGLVCLWAVPRPVDGDRAAIEAWVRRLTALELDETGTPRPVDGRP